MSNKDKIILAAHELFFENGYVNTSIKAIQEHAGTSKGLVYYHFESKDELALAVLKYIFDEEFKEFDSFSDHIQHIEAENTMEVIDAYLHQMFSSTMQERNTMQIIIDLLLNLNSTSAKENVKSLYQTYLDKISDLLSYLGVKSSGVAAKLVFSVLDGLMYLNMALGKTLNEEENKYIIATMKCILLVGVEN